MADTFATPEEALDVIRRGGMLIVTDDEQRENEGDFVMAAQHVTPAAVNFMITHGRGLLCLPAPGEKIDLLDLPMMSTRNTSKMGTPFTVSIDAREGTTTGISAYERALTIQKFVSPDAQPADFGVPGHVFPLRATPGGVLRRAGHTEATVDLARLAGCEPIGVLCEILHEDGTMARMPELQDVAARFKMPIMTIEDLIRYRRRTECLIRESTVADLPTEFGTFKLHLYESTIDDQHHLALVMGDVSGDDPVLVRVHSECLTGDALHSLRCDCGMQLAAAMRAIAEAGRGVLLYMRQEGRGIGLPAKIKAYVLQDEGADTVEANERLGFAPDLRDYGFGAQMLSMLGVHAIRLLTNNPRKVIGLEGYGMHIVERVPVRVPPNPHNERYLQTKLEKLGHLL